LCRRKVHNSPANSFERAQMRARAGSPNKGDQF
jgi:hypothetical protein